MNILELNGIEHLINDRSIYNLDSLDVDLCYSRISRLIVPYFDSSDFSIWTRLVGGAGSVGHLDIM